MAFLQFNSAREAAFDALLPIASATARALDDAQRDVEHELRATDARRAGLNPTVRAGLAGTARFGYLTQTLARSWSSVAGITKLSSPKQELQNMWFWALGDRYVLRVKHEPQDTVAPGVQRLWDEESLPAAEEVFLCWETASDFTIFDIRFATVAEPKWSIPLSSLIAASAAPAVLRPKKDSGLRIVSKRPVEEASSEDDRS